MVCKNGGKTADGAFVRRAASANIYLPKTIEKLFPWWYNKLIYDVIGGFYYENRDRGRWLGR